MGRPIVYRTTDGKRVPSVTTIIKQIGWGGEGLIYWANQQGLENKTLEEARERVTGPGTVAHAMIEAAQHGLDLDTGKVDKDVLAEAKRSFYNWHAWDDAHVKDRLSVEGAIVSDTLLFGGTHDLIYVSHQGEVCMLDFKTGNGVYPDHVVQIAGYGMLWNESHPDRQIQRYEVLRIHKDNAAMGWHSIAAESMGDPVNAFLLARRLYDLAKPIKRLVS